MEPNLKSLKDTLSRHGRIDCKIELNKLIKQLQQLNISKEFKDYDFAKKKNPNYVTGFKEGVEWLKSKVLGEKPMCNNRNSKTSRTNRRKPSMKHNLKTCPLCNSWVSNLKEHLITIHHLNKFALKRILGENQS